MAFIQANFCSAVLGKNTSINFFLPERRHRPRTAQDIKYPVLYALHGLGQDHTNWLRDGYIEHLLKEEDVIVVMPDCEKSFYTDAVHGYQFFTYLTEELPLIVGNYFSASRKREDTCIAGISMGGYGALKAALLRPDLYRQVFALSPSVQPYDAIGSTPKGMYSCTDFEANFDNIFGSEEAFMQSPNNLHNAMEHFLKTPYTDMQFGICCGRQDFLYPVNRDFISTMQCAGMNVDFFDGNGEHNWDYWNKAMPAVLHKLGLLTSAPGVSSLG